MVPILSLTTPIQSMGTVDFVTVFAPPRMLFSYSLNNQRVLSITRLLEKSGHSRIKNMVIWSSCTRLSYKIKWEFFFIHVMAKVENYDVVFESKFTVKKLDCLCTLCKTIYIANSKWRRVKNFGSYFWLSNRLLL